MEYITRPSWLYKPINVPNLKVIQEEIILFLYKVRPNFDFSNPDFIHIARKEIEPYTPMYAKFIDSLGILDKWDYSAFITLNNNLKFPIHVDSLNWDLRCYGLNLPIINCENTYTVFYDAEIESEPFKERNDPIRSSRVIKKNSEFKEIGRWDSNKPAWINISVPHAPVSLHSKPRALISARFLPELHDLLYK